MKNVLANELYRWAMRLVQWIRKMTGVTILYLLYSTKYCNLLFCNIFIMWSYIIYYYYFIGQEILKHEKIFFHYLTNIFLEN